MSVKPATQIIADLLNNTGFFRRVFHPANSSELMKKKNFCNMPYAEITESATHNGITSDSRNRQSIFSIRVFGLYPRDNLDSIRERFIQELNEKRYGRFGMTTDKTELSGSVLSSEWTLEILLPYQST
jgi:hypothetical protein